MDSQYHPTSLREARCGGEWAREEKGNRDQGAPGATLSHLRILRARTLQDWRVAIYGTRSSVEKPLPVFTLLGSFGWVMSGSPES